MSINFALSDRPSPAPPKRKLDGKQEAFLILTRCTQAAQKLLGDNFRGILNSLAFGGGASVAVGLGLAYYKLRF